ncbi:DUF4435 domain-containing protein [Methylobacter tundripaludum]|uniref:DUF4435 domain-containing protein n=1 Tax=Methylobacter tundripaludum (strain ATCC BAA-1195 / DSM 17260 / SV96) TaxID=697282 RepID=G3IVX5_METTV|nr:DUF4435 domain-containing protein [Methylobacter tundripaludum]EGW22982.1 hypothetical protein Mettu_1820 [Methylobacter tundripaludum SV96]
MQRYLSEIDTVGEIRQARRHPIGKNYLWVLVEGETDQKLYAKLIDGNNTKIEMVHGGVENLRKTLSILILETNQILGIRDADFLHLDNKQETTNGLFLTDVHDAEMMLSSCDTAFESIVAEYLSLKRARFIDFRRELLASLVFLGGIRWLNNIEDLKLNFSGIDLDKFYDSIELTLNKIMCIQEIEARSPNKKRSLQPDEIDLKIADISDHYNLCNGHDFEKAFAHHVKNHTAGTKNFKDTDIGKALRIAYRKEDFATTNLYNLLKDWEIKTGQLLFSVP